MEGLGSRLGRASSRYGPAATVFNGPVRKWKKKWVLASSPSGMTYQNQNQTQSQSQSQSNGQKLLLCRWTPITPASSTETEGDAVSPEEPPRRKFRYTPIAVLEAQKKEELKNSKDAVKTKETDQSTEKTVTVRSEIQGGLNVNELYKEEIQERNKNLNSPKDVKWNGLDLALSLNGQNENQNSLPQSS